MENNKSYFGEAVHGVKSLLTGFRVTMKEYFTPKVTEQYPENRKTTLHVAVRHRGRLVMPHDAEGNHKCIACTLCEKACPNGTITIKSEMKETEDGKKKRVLVDYQYDFENSTFDRGALVLHLDKEVKYESSLPNILDGGAPQEVGKWNTKK